MAFPSGLSYTPGVTQRLVVTVADPAQRRWGFQLTARQASDSTKQAGTFTKGSDGFTQVLCSSSLTSSGPFPNAPCPANMPYQYVEHTEAGTRVGQTQSATFTFDWTPPATDVGAIVIYVAGNAANGNSLADSGDHIYTNQYTLASASNKPAISQNGVVNGASFAPTIQSGSWVTILGSNLAKTTRTWADADFVNGKAPTALDGVSTTINNKPAFVYFIGPNQINVQAPSDENVGPVNVVVTNNGVASDPATAPLAAVAPGFFLWPGSFTVATRPDFTFAVKNGTFPGVTTVPPRPGDVIVLWGTGFGPTNPAVPAGQPVPSDQAPAVTNPPTILINNVPAKVLGAVLSPGFLGLYQIAITVPDTLPDGDWKIQAQVSGVSSVDSALITVKK